MPKKSFRKLPPRYTPIVFAFFMSSIMAFLMCLIITGVNAGLNSHYLTNVWRAYQIAMPTAFVCVLSVRPLVMLLVRWSVQQPAQPHQ